MTLSTQLAPYHSHTPSLPPSPTPQCGKYPTTEKPSPFQESNLNTPSTPTNSSSIDRMVIRYVNGRRMVDLSRCSVPELEVPKQSILESPRALFLHLTKSTVPYGMEEQYYGKFLEQLGFQQDPYGNYVSQVGKSDTVFMAHMDTADMYPRTINHIIKDNKVKTDGHSILGADDRAGMTVILTLYLNKVPGLYYFFVGEEAGCIGSKHVANSEALIGLSRAICFDRKGRKSIITHQMGSRTASNIFAATLCEELNRHGFYYESDDGGLYTDSNEFITQIPECTNISVGYANAHGNDEIQCLRHLDNLASTAVLIDWENLPTERDPADVEEDSTYEYIYGYGKDRDDDYKWDRYTSIGNGSHYKTTYEFDDDGLVKAKDPLLQPLLDIVENDWIDVEIIEEWLYQNPELAVRVMSTLLAKAPYTCKAIIEEMEEEIADTYKDNT